MLRTEDASVIAPPFQATPLFAYAPGYVVLAEALTALQIFGVGGFRGRLETSQFNIPYKALVQIAVCLTKTDTFAYHDCYLEAANVMIAADASGLGTHWIGFAESGPNQHKAKKNSGVMRITGPSRRSSSAMRGPGRPPASSGHSLHRALSSPAPKARC